MLTHSRGHSSGTAASCILDESEHTHCGVRNGRVRDFAYGRPANLSRATESQAGDAQVPKDGHSERGVATVTRRVWHSSSHPISSAPNSRGSERPPEQRSLSSGRLARVDSLRAIPIGIKPRAIRPGVIQGEIPPVFASDSSVGQPGAAGGSDLGTQPAQTTHFPI